MLPAIRRLAAPVALASLLPACPAPATGEDGSSGTTAEPTSTTEVDPTTPATGSTSDAPTTTGDPSTGAPPDTTDTTDTTGAPVEPTWLQVFDAPDGQHPGGLGLAADGSLWVAGDFYGSIDLGLGALAGEGTGLYLARFTATGEPTHAQAIFPADGAPTLTQIAGLGVGSDGSVVVSGWLEGTYQLGGDTLVADEVDVHVAKWDVDGAPLWGQRFGQADWQV
ncbi:MAG TPA: hypothetical protein VGB85_10570, partial [Nannocystis sp.]